MFLLYWLLRLLPFPSYWLLRSFPTGVYTRVQTPKSHVPIVLTSPVVPDINLLNSWSVLCLVPIVLTSLVVPDVSTINGMRFPTYRSHRTDFSGRSRLNLVNSWSVLCVVPIVLTSLVVPDPCLWNPYCDWVLEPVCGSHRTDFSGRSRPLPLESLRGKAARFVWWCAILPAHLCRLSPSYLLPVRRVFVPGHQVIPPELRYKTSIA